MPRISYFYGIAIYMYWDEADHPLPHFHAEYEGQWASISSNGDLLRGTLDRRALRMVRKWAALHRGEIEANWLRARNLQGLDEIPPLP